MDANSMSAVIKVLHRDQAWALLAGDMDQSTLDRMIRNDRDLTAPILVFPHHGGLPADSDPTVFANSLCESVRPSIVVFSNSREGRYDNPRPEIMAGLTARAPRVACTQISRTCMPDITSLPYVHLNDLPAKGAGSQHSCAGSMVFTPENTGLSNLDAHRQFVGQCMSGRLCVRHNIQPPPRVTNDGTPIN